MSVRTLPILALTLLAGAAPAPGEPAAPGLPARLEILRGRAMLADGNGVVDVSRGDGPYLVSGQGHLELAPGARAVVRWAGQATLELEGPTSLTWLGAGAGPLHWTFGSVHAADLEIRGRGARVDLPDSWRLWLGRGACSLYGLAGGGTELRHRAGEAARAYWVGGERTAPPPIPVVQGVSLRLVGAPRVESPEDRTPLARAWSVGAWPWGEGGIPDTPDLIPVSTRSWKAEEWPWGVAASGAEPWERWGWPWIDEGEAGSEAAPGTTGEGGTPPDAAAEIPLEVDALLEDPPERADPFPPAPWSPGVEPTVDADREARREPLEPSSPTPAVEPGDGAAGPEAPGAPAAPGAPGTPTTPAAPPGEEPGAAPEPEPPPSPAGPHDPAQWRGLEASQIEVHPGFRLQKSPHWVIEELPRGRRKIHLSRESKDPAWFLGRYRDCRLFPGAEVELDAEGRLDLDRGWVRIVDAPEGRGL